jgi:hypothetical protein
MNRLITVLFFILLLPGIVLAGTTGKLKGKVTDQQTGEPLIGANVLVIGTSFGAATDVNGQYTISNLESGFYEVKFSYIGYQTKSISNIRINADLTTELNLQLAPEGVQVADVLVVAEKPLINKYNTNANRITTSEDIEALPVRGVENILALTPGVIVQDNTVFIRGGRQDEVGYYLEGTSITDPMVGGARVTLVQDALEELNVQSGGYTAEFGNANSGIIRTQIKTGSPQWRLSAEYITDNMGFQGSDSRYSGEKTLGAYWYGYNEFIGSVSGPLGTPNVKLFALFNYNYVRDQNPQGLPGFNLGLIGDASFGDTLLLKYPAGPIQGNSLENYTGTGSLQLDFNPTIVRLIGTYTSGTAFNPWSTARTSGVIGNFLNVDRTEKLETSDLAVNLKVTQLISPTTFLELNVGYAANDLNRFDPLLGDNFLINDSETGWGGYGDSLTNANLAGVTWTRDRGGTLGRYERPKRFNLFLFSFNAPGDVVAGYQKFDRRNYNGTLQFNTIVSKVHNIKVGGEYQYYDIRNYGLNNETTMNLPGLLNQNELLADDDPQKITSDNLIRRRGVNNFGYDPMGNRTNDGLPEWEQARNPVFLGIYAQDRFEAEDLIINLGLRYDYIDIANWVPVDPSRPELTWQKDNDLVTDESGTPTGLVKTPTFDAISPRLGFSFPITDQTVFHAQWGKFVQQTRLRDIYQGVYATGRQIAGGFFIAAPVGFNVRPTRTTQYEVGFTQQIGDFASVDITGFYKDIIDQVVYEQQNLADPNSPFGAYAYLRNGDFATTKGVEIAFNMRRVERFLAYGSLSFTDAQGTNSFPNSSRGIVGAPLEADRIFQPQYINPLEYNNAIRGNLNLDYRFGKGDGGPFFQESGLSLLTTFTSGHPYTRGEGAGDLTRTRFRQPTEPLGASTTPSTFQLDLRLDKTFNIADVLDLNVYIFVINITDARNVANVHVRSGSAEDDGFLGGPGEVTAASLGPDFVATYNAINNLYSEEWRIGNSGAATITNPFMWGPPRQVRLGIRLEY